MEKKVCPLVDIIDECLEAAPREPLIWTYHSGINFRVYSTALTILRKDYYFDN
jgi:hypothetical protein